MPRIRDTETQIALLEGLGVKAELDGAERAPAAGRRGQRTRRPTRTLASRIRASFLLAGPLLARFGEAKMPPPGGDTIGRRRLDPHLDAFRDMGAKVDGDRLIELTRRPTASSPAGSSWTSPR